MDCFQRDGAGRPAEGGPRSGSDEVGPPAVTMIYSHPSKRTTSSVTALRAAPPSPESAASLPGEGFGDRRQQLDKSVFACRLADIKKSIENIWNSVILYLYFYVSVLRNHREGDLT